MSVLLLAAPPVCRASLVPFRAKHASLNVAAATVASGGCCRRRRVKGHTWAQGCFAAAAVAARVPSPPVLRTPSRQPSALRKLGIKRCCCCRRRRRQGRGCYLSPTHTPATRHGAIGFTWAFTWV